MIVKSYLPRIAQAQAIATALRRYPVVALVGARQTGKTTLALRFISNRTSSHYLDLENPEDRTELSNPMLALKDRKGLVTIDEIQRQPELFPVLRVLADRRPLSSRFLILGSASGHLLRQSAETLAGRIATIELTGFSCAEIGNRPPDRLWLRGGFPKAFLAPGEPASFHWRQEFIRTFLERDMPQLGIRIPSSTLHRFWTMIGHYHAQTWNGSDIARSFGVSDTTVRHYLDILTDAFMIRQLPPWFENVGKRLVKAPKIYFRDSGILHALLGIRTMNELRRHPKLGASWEGFALEQVLRIWREGHAYFYATHGGAELDLLIMDGRNRLGFEFKFSDAPVVSKSMHVALQDLRLKHLWVVYPGSRVYRLHKKITAVPLAQVPVP